VSKVVYLNIYYFGKLYEIDDKERLRRAILQENLEYYRQMIDHEDIRVKNREHDKLRDRIVIVKSE
jgi:hypothetical protein